MASAKQDYEQFVAWLHAQEPSFHPDVLRLANLILANFDTVEPTSYRQSERSVLLTGLARHQLMSTSQARQEASPTASPGEQRWRRLRHLTVGPFRGFRTPEPFALEKRVVLVYGPNGSGKSSFCEALEYALTGTVAEADARRITDSDFLANTHERRFDPPVLTASAHSGAEVAVSPDADAHRFDFIERNRIESFARMAARPNAQRAELIATLFGMESFSEFVRNFNDTMDRELVLANTKQRLVEQGRAALAADQALITSEAQGLSDLTAAETTLASTHSTEMDYSALKVFIGTDEQPGRLRHLEDIVNSVPPQLRGVTRFGIQSLYREADSAQSALDAVNARLQERSTQVSFKDLYMAVSALQASTSGCCPACDTPLEGPIHVVRNPYEKAESGLAELQELASLQTEQSEAQEAVSRASRALKAQLDVVASFVSGLPERHHKLDRYLDQLPAEPTGVWWKGPYEAEENADSELPTLTCILDHATQIEEQDAGTRLTLEQRPERIAERNRLLQLSLQIAAQDERRRQFSLNLASARQRIAAFELTNATLIQEAAQEVLNIARDAPIKAAYDAFLVGLRRYRDQLPGTLMANLNDRARTLYNEFNASDLEADKLAQLHLPRSGTERIEISFVGAPETRVDALQVLSEGHIRCLGLAILLAKNLSLNRPLVVFDDAINAIDHDHRCGIRETIFESNHFSSVQVIVTCHSNEFVKDIENNLPRPAQQDAKTYVIKHHDGDHQPRVIGNVPSRRYVEMARIARTNLNDRGALDASRKALELITERVWHWLASHRQGEIKVPLERPKAEPTLWNMCTALRSCLSDAETFAHNNKQPVLTSLGDLLGIPKTNLVWLYLNKGTHEERDRDDFDGVHVETVVSTLERLDALDLRKGR